MANIKVRSMGAGYLIILEDYDKRYDENKLFSLNGGIADQILIMRDKNYDEIIINKDHIDSITDYMDIETVYKIYAEANIWLDKRGTIIKPNEYYRIEFSNKLIYFCEDTNICKILETRLNEKNYFIVYDDVDDKYQIIYRPYIDESFSIEVDLPFQAENEEYYAITNEGKLLGPGNKLEIMDALYHSPLG